MVLSARTTAAMMEPRTEDFDIESLAKNAGMKFEWDNTELPWTGMNVTHEGDRVIISSVILDGPAYQAGLNAGDELVAINGMRMLKDRYADYAKFLRLNETYTFTVSRLSSLQNVGVTIGQTPAKIRAISLTDKSLAQKALMPKNK